MSAAAPALTSGSLFAGCGGLAMAVEQALGTRTVWLSEYEPPTPKTPRPTQSAARILAHRYPDVPNFGDITAIDWRNVEPVDVIEGGSPCQDVSAAGKRAGMRAGTRSGLWASMCDAVDIIRPRLVIWENVRGVLSAAADSPLEPCPLCVADRRRPNLRALGRVLGDLSELGYDAAWCGLRAADIGAPHGRYRVFVLAWPAADTDGIGPVRGGAARGRRPGPADGGQSDTGSTGWGDYGPAVRRWERILNRPAPAPTELSPRGKPRLSARAVEWLMGLPDGWVTDVPGLSRTDQLKALGNGVVPQQGAAAITHLLTFVPDGQR